MTMEDNSNNEAASIDEFLKYIRHESSGSSSSSNNAAAVAHRRDIIIRRHALEQLIEATIGADVSAAATTAAAVAERGGRKEDNDDFSMVVRQIMNSTVFCQTRYALRNICFVDQQISSSPSTTTTVTVDGLDSSSKKAKQFPRDAFAAAAISTPTKTKTISTSSLFPPTSFSLFALLDSQGGAGGEVFPPRIMASQIINTSRRESESNAPPPTITNDTDSTTLLELFEKAEDMEDLSPDADSWEEIRTILFIGLSRRTGEGNDDAARYLRVHETLFEKCRGNDALKIQFWGLVQNIVGSILANCIEFGDYESSSAVVSKQNLDNCWDALHSLLDVVSHMAVDYVMSSVGNELEIERMLVGLCMILSNNYSACILGMMEPIAGSFEVWSRFVDPDRFIAIVYASGLVGVLLRRCDCLGKSAASEIIWKTIQPCDTTSLNEIEHCNHLQSLSILRTILFRCDGSPQILSLIHDQFTTLCNSDGSKNSILSLFVCAQGVASPRDTQTILSQAQERWKLQWKQTKQSEIYGKMQPVLKPFRQVLQLNESNSGFVDSDAHLLCKQIIEMVSL